MVTKSIVGRFLIATILVVAVGVVAQAAMILASGGKKAVKTASAVPVSAPSPADQAPSPAADPIRVVYPGPLGDATAQAPKLTDAASPSPLTSSAPQPTAKLAQAMAVTAASAPQPAPAAAAAPQPVAAPLGTASPPLAAAPAPAAAQPAPSSAAAEPDPQATGAPAAPPAAPRPAPARVQVASLGGGAPAADATSGSGVNINSASVEALNRLGGGHIGESIAKHRPYRSVEDLVKRRILRRSVYNQIRGEIAAR